MRSQDCHVGTTAIDRRSIHLGLTLTSGRVRLRQLGPNPVANRGRHKRCATEFDDCIAGQLYRRKAILRKSDLYEDDSVSGAGANGVLACGRHPEQAEPLICMMKSAPC